MTWSISTQQLSPPAPLVATYWDNSTWVKPDGSWTHADITVIGGGGGGGSGRFSTSGTSGGGGGGGAGGRSTATVAKASLNATETVTIGMGGAGGAARLSASDGATGGNGGSSSFGAHESAGGGSGGTGGTGAAGGTGGGGGTGDSAGGTGGNGGYASNGSAGADGSGAGGGGQSGSVNYDGGTGGTAIEGGATGGTAGTSWNRGQVRTLASSVGNTGSSATTTSASVSPSNDAFLMLVWSCSSDATALNPTTSTTCTNVGSWTTNVYYSAERAVTHVVAYAKVTGAAGTGTFTLTTDSALTNRNLYVLEVTGATGVTQIIQGIEDTTNGQPGATPYNVTIAQPLYPNSVIVTLAVATTASLNIHNVPSGIFTEWVDSDISSTNVTEQICYARRHSGSTVSWTYSNTTDSRWAVVYELTTPYPYAGDAGRGAFGTHGDSANRGGGGGGGGSKWAQASADTNTNGQSVAGPGGDGGWFGAGGGGGGGCRDSNSKGSGAGGNGSNGLVVVRCYTI